MFLFQITSIEFMKCHCYGGVSRWHKEEKDEEEIKCVGASVVVHANMKIIQFLINITHGWNDY